MGTLVWRIEEVKGSDEKATIGIILTLMSLNLSVVTPYSQSQSSSTTYVSGHVSEDSTWRLADSPYIPTSDVILDSGATLTIEPGVETRFDGNFSLMVYGSLYAVGTKTSRILFTSNKAEASAGDWNTIEFLGGGNTSFILKHCVVQCAVDGVTIQSQQVAVIESSEISNNLHSGINAVGSCNLLIEGNIIKLNQYGIVGCGDVSSGLLVSNNTLLHNNYGVNVHSGGADPLITNMTFTNNNFSYNNYGIFLYSGMYAPLYSQSGYITNFMISGNFFSFGEYGIYVETRSWGSNSPSSMDNSYIKDGVISNNTVFFHNNGIYLYSGGAWYRYVYDVTVSDNVVSSNKVGIYLNAHHYELVQFDVTMTSNIFSSNEKGIHINGTAKTDIAQNSISYNSYGITYIGTKDNLASSNDIYLNFMYGMYVTEDARVNAQDNYWGDATGPYHDELNPNGMGNAVNGEGADLNFSQFLAEPIGRINQPPISDFQVDKARVGLNEVVTLDASASSDDDGVYRYFFDFGDGTNSNWTTASVVPHSYLSLGTYEVRLSVVDNLGVKSLSVAMVSIIVTEELLPLDILVILNSTLLLSGESLTVTVLVTSEDSCVSGAAVTLSSDKSGAFSSSNGTTDEYGRFNSSFTPPTVTTQTLCTITVNVTKIGYSSAQDRSQVILMSTPEKGAEPYNQALIIIVVSAVTIIATIILRKRRKRGLTTSTKRRSIKHSKTRLQPREICVCTGAFSHTRIFHSSCQPLPNL